MLKAGAAVITAATIVVGGGASILVLMWQGIIEADAGLPILSGLIGGGSVYLWNKKNTDITPPG